MMPPGLPLLTADEHCFARTFDDPCGPMGFEHSSWVLIGVETVRQQNATDPTDWDLVTVYYWAARKDGKPLAVGYAPPGAVREYIGQILGESAALREALTNERSEHLAEADGLYTEIARLKARLELVRKGTAK